MVITGPNGIKANKMVGHIQHILNVPRKWLLSKQNWVI